MPKSVRILNCLSYGVLLLALLGIVFSVVNLVYPYQPMKIACPAKVLNKNHEVRHGEVLEVVIDYEKTVDKSCVVSRQFVNDFVYVMPSYTSNYPVGKKTVVSYSTKVPMELPLGEYTVRTTLEYEYPPFRTVVVTFSTERFKVVE